YQHFYPDGATVVQIDIRGEQIGRRTAVDLGLIGDVKTTLTLVSPKLSEKTDDKHLRDSLDHYRKARQGLDDLATCEPVQKPIHPQYVARLIDEVAREDAIFACDVGTP